jgi:hypothetical protein
MRNLRPYLLALFAAPLLALAVPDGGSAESARSARAAMRIDVGIVKAIRHYRFVTLRLDDVMGRPAAHLPPVRHVSLRRAHRIWRHRAVVVRRRFVAGPAHRRAWLCIHRYEGSWRDSGSPYYGGLQMDLGFQEHYGRVLLRAKGTADHWTPLEQMWIAEKAYRSGRGFYPWPNTARSCGLI